MKRHPLKSDGSEEFEVAYCAYPDDPAEMEKELAIATFCRCAVLHPKLKSVECLRARGHSGKHYCGGSSVGIEWEDEERIGG